MDDKLNSENVSCNLRLEVMQKLSLGFCRKIKAYRKGSHLCILFLALMFFALASTALAQPAMSRGEQLLPISYDECIRRAEQAYIAEGWVNIGKGGAFVNAFKDANGAYIMCNVAPENKVWVNIVVASSSQDDKVPGAERVKLQGRMDKPGGNVKGNLIGKWNIKCCNDSLVWESLNITNQDGDTFSGSFTGEHLGGDVTNGRVRGNIIEFVRSGSWGKQVWTAKLVNDGGGLRMINGVWTGDYVDRFQGRNNWHAEKK